MMSDYFPLAAGVCTLVGVALTLYVSGRRDKDEQDRERIDATRAELRKEASELLAVMYEFAASADNLGSGIDSRDVADGAIEKHEKITLRLRALAMRVRLLTDDSRLVEPIEEVILAYQGVNDNLTDPARRGHDYERFTAAMHGLINGLYTVAVPTDIIKGRQRAVSWWVRRRWAKEARARRKALRGIFRSENGEPPGSE